MYLGSVIIVVYIKLGTGNICFIQVELQLPTTSYQLPDPVNFDKLRALSQCQVLGNWV